MHPADDMSISNSKQTLMERQGLTRLLPQPDFHQAYNEGDDVRSGVVTNRA